MSSIAIVVGHPRGGTLCESLAESYRRGAAAAGHEVTLFALGRMAFDPILHDGFSSAQPLEPDLQAAQDAIGAADHVVIVFPLWLGDMPALLKGFLERILQPGFAMEKAAGPARFRPLLRGKSARIVATMGMPALVYRWWFGAHAVKLLRRNILQFVGIRPVRTTLLGMVEAGAPDRRRRWLDAMEGLGRAAR